jgi:mono/diheme cytochrome c family protein
MMTQRKVDRRIIHSRRLLAVLFVLLMMAAGCANGAPEVIEPTSVPVATDLEEIAPTSAVSTEQLAFAATVGDIAAGEELFNQPVDGVPHSWSCSSCHTLDGNDTQSAPTLAGISAIAGDRVVGLSDVDYLRQSIVDPNAFHVDGEWRRGSMPHQYPDLLSDDQINNLIAFLLTR